VSGSPDSPREVIDVGVVGPSSPLSGCIIPLSVEGDGFSQSRDWPVGFDQNGGLWFGRRTLIFGMDCPWIGRWMTLFWGGGLGNWGCHGRRISTR
jgi:hypothetical protein